jgi:hypothetical protein
MLRSLLLRENWKGGQLLKGRFERARCARASSLTPLALPWSCRPNSLVGFRNVGAAVDQGADIDGAYQR